MRFLNINITEEATGKKIGRVKIPIFVISLVGKHTPDFVYALILKRVANTDIEDKDELTDFFKEVVQILVKVLKDSASDEQLKMYYGILAESVSEGERIVVSIS